MRHDAAVPFLIYGAYGFTGELVAREAVSRGLRPHLAGRDAAALEPLAQELGLPWRAFPLEDGAALGAALEEVGAVIHCAGPFVHTWQPMAEACLASGCHYLDITGEADIFLALAELGSAAEEAGVVLLPGVGFDVVPTDCLAAHLARRLPGARSLTLAFHSPSRPSRGTAATIVEHAHRGGLVRRGGVLTRVPVAWRSRTVDFGLGPAPVVSIPWGDVVTAWYTTGIPDIEVYMAIPEARLRRLRLVRPLLPLLRWKPIKALSLRRVRRGARGPSAQRLETGETRVWGEAQDGQGVRVAARLRGPQSYRWTALTAVSAVSRVLSGEASPGFRTPAGAFGPDFVLESPGVEREDL